MKTSKALQLCGGNEVYLTPALEQDLNRRLSRIEGQVRGVKKMLVEHRDCESLLIQASAVRAAMGKVLVKLLEGHMETCVADSVKCDQGAEAVARLKGALATVLKQS